MDLKLDLMQYGSSGGTQVICKVATLAIEYKTPESRDTVREGEVGLVSVSVRTQKSTLKIF